MEQKETITTNTSALGEVYQEVFDVKLTRTRNVLSPRCEKCYNWGHHHRPQCEYATRADALHHMDEARKREKNARESAAEWLQACRMMHGKIAILKHENNKLRKKVEPQPARANKPPAATGASVTDVWLPMETAPEGGWSRADGRPTNYQPDAVSDLEINYINTLKLARNLIWIAPVGNQYLYGFMVCRRCINNADSGKTRVDFLRHDRSKWIPAWKKPFREDIHLFQYLNDAYAAALEMCTIE